MAKNMEVAENRGTDRGVAIMTTPGSPADRKDGSAASD